jgi:hypothetical protein
MARSATRPPPSSATPANGKFGPFAKQLFIADQSHSNLSRVFLETINGIKQGVVIPFRGGFTSGLIGGRMDEEGRIFVGGSDRGWGARGGKPFCFEKCEWTGKTPFESPRDAREAATASNSPSPSPSIRSHAGDVKSYSMREFTYAYREQYGGDEIDEIIPKITAAKVGRLMANPCASRSRPSPKATSTSCTSTA